jgi:hypothetical protein
MVSTSTDIKVYNNVNDVYTLTAAIGCDLSGHFDGSDIGFASSSGRVSVDSMGQSHVHPAAGGWALQTFTLTGDVLVSKSKLAAGAFTEILLSPSDGCYIDNVTLTATGPDFASVPEPSTIVLLASGLIGLLAYAWRKRR